MRSVQSPCGWAFSSVTRPWVAQRVWATPVVAGGAATATPPAPFPSCCSTAARRFGEVADRADAVDPAVLDHRDAGRVVAAVLELLEPGDQQVAAGAPAHVSDDSAHEDGKSRDPRPMGPKEAYISTIRPVGLRPALA